LIMTAPPWLKRQLRNSGIEGLGNLGIKGLRDYGIRRFKGSRIQVKRTKDFSSRPLPLRGR
jgi:hypothetical protein